MSPRYTKKKLEENNDRFIANRNTFCLSQQGNKLTNILIHIIKNQMAMSLYGEIVNIVGILRTQE